MTERIPDDSESGVLLKVLTAHYHALACARSDETVLKQYAALLRFLRSKHASFLEEHGKPKRTGTERPLLSPTINEDELRNASLDELERIVSDGGTSRKNLEFIAIQRFSVPRGSMRSFSNKQMLVDKLRTLIRNERTHETIGAVARGQSTSRTDS